MPMHFRAKGVSISTATVRSTSITLWVEVLNESSVELVFQLYRWRYNTVLTRARGIPPVSHTRIFLRKFAAVRYVIFEHTSNIISD